ncbi:glycosyltransferase family 2 protein [Flavobacterium sp.]|uniref:glycosyltransferase family 2 protein n=1 Tax=Flavobacterium sp. TaxID=239 RepID=UPI0025D80AF4|nr:glycosyltransferase family 2 protein [Flavobacterium sp.]
MHTMNIQVSIIMATYNRAHFIVETLLSIQKQTFTAWECIIIDDGGTDNTTDVIQPILEKDARFSYHKRTALYQKGLPGCRNYGLDLAQGQYIIFFDDDDIVHPQNLECCVAELANPEVAFCRYQRTVFTGDFNYEFDYSMHYTKFEISSKDVEKLLTFKLPFNSCAVMWRKTCFDENRFVESLMFAEEWELYPRILSTGIKGVSIDKTLFFGRKHPNSNTGEFSRRDVVRRASKKEAILLVIINLKRKGLLSKSIVRYFLGDAVHYKEFNLFDEILKELDLPWNQKLYWKIFYTFLPLRLAVLKAFKKLFSK